MKEKKRGTKCSSVDIITAIIIFLILTVTVIVWAPFIRKSFTDCDRTGSTPETTVSRTADPIAEK